MTRIANFAWSYSALTMYEQCPKKYYHIYVAKDVKDEDSAWSADGKIVHDAMKKRVCEGTPLPLNLRHYEKIAAQFAAARGEKHGELKLALTREFEPCDYFAPNVWVRVIIDLAIIQDSQTDVQGPTKTAIVVDWKTGKPKDGNDKFTLTQMQLNSAVLARWMPEVGLFKTLFVWLQNGSITPKNYTLSMFPAVWNDLIPRAAKIEEARKTTTFPAKPGPLCRGYCPVKECPHYVPKDRP